MSETVSEFIVKRMKEWGVNRVFGYPGDGINGIMGALDKYQEEIEFVQVRHEEMSAFMACGHAKFTGEVGVCIATSGPGAIHLLNGLYDAKLDHQPVVAIIGQQARSVIGGSYQQEVDLVTLFKDVAHEYVYMASVPEQARHLIDRAFRIAKAERAVTCVVLPNDLQELDAVEHPKHAHAMMHSGIGVPVPRILPNDTDLARAAKVLNEGERVAILIGAGAKNAAEEVTQIADILGAGVAKALLGKDILADELPFVTGSIGLLGTGPSYAMMEKCDTLLMIGSGFPYPEFLPQEGKARGVQIDIDPGMLSIRFPMEVNLTGDSKETLQALIPLLKRKEDRSWREKIEDSIQRWWKTLEERAMGDAEPLNPQRVVWEMSKYLPDNCIAVADTGSVTSWYARDLKLRTGMMGSVSGTLATMGPAMPYAIAAKFAYPDRVVVALVGDGGMQMNGNEELITVMKYWKKWADPRFVVLVMNNHDLNMVTWEQRVMVGNPKFEGSQNLPDFPYANYASSLGLLGIKVESPDQLDDAWERAFNADRPVLIEAVTDPNVPPLPPHITLEQAKNYAKAILKGDPDRVEMVKHLFKDVVDNYLHI